MAEVTREMILSYMHAKGGVVKNVDLVRHFRKYLQIDNPRAKGIARMCLFFLPAIRPGLLKQHCMMQEHGLILFTFGNTL